MATIECTAGPASTSVAGVTYNFDLDQYGRFVADVYDEKHIELLLSVVHYKEVPEHPEADADEPATEPMVAASPGPSFDPATAQEPGQAAVGITAAPGSPTAVPTAAPESETTVAAVVAPEPEAPGDQSLLGSSILASTYSIGGKDVQLGEIVASAFERFGGSVLEWNVMPEDDREALLRADLDRRLDEEAKSAQPATSAAAKPTSTKGSGKKAKPTTE